MFKLTLLVALGLLAVSATRADAQTMSFSVYHDAYVSGGTVYLYGSVIDGSSGCSHGSYSTTATIYSPSWRSASSQSWGLQANTQLPFDAEFGNYTVIVNGTYYCNCGQQHAGFGGGQTISIPPPPGPPRVTINSDTNTFDQVINGVPSRRRDIWYWVSTQESTNWPYGGTITEHWDGIQNPCNLQTGGNLSGSASLNASSQFPDTYFASTHALCSQGCTFTGTQHYRLSTYNTGSSDVRTNTVDYTCPSISVLGWP